MWSSNLALKYVVVGLILAIPALAWVILRLVEPDLPNYALALLGWLYGIPLATVVVYFWLKVYANAVGYRRKTRLMVLTSILVVLALGSAYLLSRGIWKIGARSSPESMAPQTTKPAPVPVDAPMSESERQLHARAVRAREDGAVQWMNRVASSSAHGPAGQIPEFLAVDVKGNEVMVRNHRNETIRLAISRSGGCGYRSAKGPEFLVVPSGSTAVFVPGPACPKPAGDLEFRVGDPALDDPVGWWTDSAIARWQAIQAGRR